MGTSKEITRSDLLFIKQVASSNQLFEALLLSKASGCGSTTTSGFEAPKLIILGSL